MKYKSKVQRNVTDLAETEREKIKQRILQDGWSAANICIAFNLKLSSFLSYYREYIPYLNTKCFIGSRQAYYTNEDWHPWRKEDGMSLWVNEFSNSQTIKEYVQELEKKKISESNKNTGAL